MRTPAITIAAAVAVALGATACGSAADDLVAESATADQTDGATAPDGPRDAWEQLLTGIGPGGEVPLDVALGAFEIALGDLPGVDVEGDVLGGPTSGTAALNWLSGYEDQLAAEQLAAVQQALAPVGAAGSDDGTGDGEGAGHGADDEGAAAIVHGLRRPAVAPAAAIFGDHSCTINGDSVSEDGPGAEEYRALVDEVTAEVGRFLGEELGVPLHIWLGVAKTGSQTIAWLSPQTSGECATDLATSCQMQLLENNIGSNRALLRHTIAHEVVHCFQARWLPVHASLQAPPWIAEGFAEFVAASIYPGANATNANLYLLSTQVPLDQRTYDAQGFWFHLDEVGGDPVATYREAFRAQDTRQAFQLLTAPAGDAFADTWASAMSMEPSFGDAWWMPDMPTGTKGYVPLGFVPNGKTVNVSIDWYQTKLVRLEVQAEVVTISHAGNVSGRLLWAPGDEELLSDLTRQTYCNLPGGCECPSGTTPFRYEALPAPSALFAAAGVRGTDTIVVRGETLTDACRPRPSSTTAPPAPVDPCLVGSWVSEEWGVAGLAIGMDAVGGAGARVEIGADGQVSWDFDGMDDLVSTDVDLGVSTAQGSVGTAEGSVWANGGDWTIDQVDTALVRGYLHDNVMGQMPLPGGGPAVLVMLEDGTYDCSGSGFTYETRDPASNDTVAIEFEPA